jgi:membrane protein implicated in regulation of membrane protease activity
MCHVILFSFPILGLALFYFFPLGVALPAYLGVLGASVLFYYKIFGALAARVQTGMEGMVGEEALVIEDLSPEGKVSFRNEIWTASAKGKTLLKGMKVTIRQFQGLALIVSDLENETKRCQSPKCSFLHLKKSLGWQ